MQNTGNTSWQSLSAEIKLRLREVNVYPRWHKQQETEWELAVGSSDSTPGLSQLDLHPLYLEMQIA